MEASELERLLEEHRAAAGVVGAAAGVLIDDQLITACAGNASLDPHMNVVPETRFHIVSVTKTLVATVLARLHGKERISFDDPVAKHVPEVQVAKWSETLTLRHLLANTAGLPLRIAWDQEYEAEGDDCLARLAAEISNDELMWAPGSLWGYTNLGWSLLGRVIETTTGLGFEEAMRRESFDPIGMASTGFAHEGGSEPASHAFDMKDGEPRTVEPWNARALGPAGGTVWSTVEDLLRFGRLHLSDGVLPSGARYAPEGILAGLREPSIDLRIPDWLDAWGLGLARWDWPGATAYGWDGVDEGFRASFRFMPRLNAAFVLLTNSTTGREAYRGLIREVVPRLGGGSIPPDHLEPGPPPSGGLGRFSGVYGFQTNTSW